MFGKIKHKTSRGFAFVRPHDTNGGPLQDLFLHHSEYSGDWETLRTGDTVEFTPGLRRGNPVAMEVSPVASAGGDGNGRSSH